MTNFRYSTELDENRWVEITGRLAWTRKYGRTVEYPIIEEITNLETGDDLYDEVPQRIRLILEEEITEAVENGRA